MSRPSNLLWFTLICIALLPTAAGRVLLDVAGGFIVILLALPILLTGLGWLGWRYIQSQLVQCNVCGTSVMKGTIQCPGCGSIMSQDNESQQSSKQVRDSIPASSATIDITATETDENTNPEG